MKVIIAFITGLLPLYAFAADIITGEDGRNSAQDSYMNDDPSYDIDKKVYKGITAEEKEGISGKDKKAGLTGYNLINGKYKDTENENIVFSFSG